MDNDINTINNAINNTINIKTPNINWGFNDRIKQRSNINIIIKNIILLFLLWSFVGIFVSIIKKKKIILSILLGPLILYR